MDTIPANLCILVEQLEDARLFYDGAARQTSGDRRERHRGKSLAYAAMLSEIDQWKSRNTHVGRVPHPGTSTGRPGRKPCHDDGYAALLERVYRIHRGAAPTEQAVRIRATGDAMDGEARDGHRRAGKRVSC